MAAYVDPASYRVHVPTGVAPSDHRLVTAAIDL